LLLIQEVLRRKRSENGILRQDIDFEQGRTVLEEIQGFVDIKIVEKKLEEINHLLVTRTD
jgi:ATP-binding cassette subfamily F protein 3